ncbi:hypothetical protein [Microbacterium lacticum]|uniref:hypothetical protein n=1 Tax=Microbacterium lacticum TaxID=33885 RepID=UPI001F5108A6|nr:hypothetical protein [Microbacterium lacticum]
MAHKNARPPLRERVREAGGWYAWINRTLIRAAGPAFVGPYESAPEPVRTERPCPLCGAPMSSHTFDRSGPKPIMHCP